MKRNMLLFVVVVLCLATLPARAQMTALQFNDKLAYITDSLYAKGQRWGTLFAQANTEKNFAMLTPSREALEKFIDAKIAEVKNMKDVKNSKDLRMAMLSFLNYEKKMVNEAFKPMERLGKTATEADVQKALENLTTLSKDEAGELQKVADAQEAYAKVNGFAIEPTAADTTTK